jgi:hypothetical protein
VATRVALEQRRPDATMLAATNSSHAMGSPCGVVGSDGGPHGSEDIW